MNRTTLYAVLALAFAAPALAQDTTSPVDSQAMDTYSKNAQPPPAAPPVHSAIDSRSVDTSSDADVQAAVTYSKNASPAVPSATTGRSPSIVATERLSARHRAHRRRHHVADHALTPPASSTVSIPPNN